MDAPMYSLLLSLYIKCKYTVTNTVRAWAQWLRFSQVGAHRVERTHCHPCWHGRGDVLEG